MKLNKQIVEDYNLAYAAGILIGFGVIINTITTNAIVGSLFFSFGLLAIIQLHLPLFTGRIGFIQKFDRKYIRILIANLLGAITTIGLYCAVKPEFSIVLSQLGSIKFSKGYLQIFICGILCGALIHFAIKAKKDIVTVLAIAIFILIGAEHCIADFPFLITHLNFENVGKFLLIILGNSLGAFVIEKISTPIIKENKNAICKDSSQ